MNKKLNIQQFIEQHSDWEKLLVEKPYCLNITRESWNGMNLVMLKYSQVDSDFSLPIVCECRGLILNEDTNEIVSFPFTKFFNFSETNAAEIDWTTARCGEKIDGSLVKIVNVGDNLLISTNGTILASKAPIAEQLGCRYSFFGDIVAEQLDAVLEKSGWQKKLQEEGLCALWEEGYTYMFELCSPWTRVVVPHKENKLYFLGKRNNETFEETYFTDDPVFSKIFDTPKVFSLKSIDECLAATKAMPWDEEGYVVCDDKFNRVKVKSPSYVAAHHLKGNSVMSYTRAIELVRANEIEEICKYFEEFRAALEECKARFWKLVEDTEKTWSDYLKIDTSLSTRKDKALWITNNFKMPGIAFGLLDKKITSVRDFFMTCPADKLLKHLGYKEQ